MRVFAITSVLIALIGCAESVDPPVAAGLDSDDVELAGHLAGLYASASGLPESDRLRGRLALAYDANGFTEAAATTYAQAQALQPGEFLWPYMGAFAHATQGDLDGAVARVDEAIALDPAYPPAWLQRGTWLLDLDRLDAATAAFGQALGLKPTGEVAIAAQAGLARIRLREGLPEEAIETLEPLVAEIDHHPQLHALLGRAYRAAGRVEDAAAATDRGRDAPPFEWRDERREATEAHVRGFHGRLGLAETYLKRGNAHRAATLLEDLHALRPDDRTLINNLSIAYQRTGRPDQATDVLRAGLDVHPDYALFHFNLGSLAEDAGRADEAVGHFGAAIKRDPALAAAYERRAILLMHQGRPDAARSDLEALVPLGGATVAFHHAAMIAGSRGRWASAVALLERAVELDPAFATGHVFLGRALAEAGRYDEARAVLADADALGTHPDDVAAARRRLRTLETDAS